MRLRRESPPASQNGKRGRLRVFSEAEEARPEMKQTHTIPRRCGHMSVACGLRRQDELGIGTLLGDYEEQGQVKNQCSQKSRRPRYLEA